ncbi:MAG: hypothetical protein AUK54_03090 [Helicobacteraceae bacterium CG2_30_36_10]|nr:MAG: hypothetical protein AUK54_03090 [Helicobacteraceae bacterium CG2_30_36_10]
MEKEDILGHLRAAKAAHIKWVQKAKLLISGVDIKEESIPVNSTECKFGKWFYSDGQVLNALSNNPPECMKKIEKLHFELHDIYLKIFMIYFTKAKGGFFSKLFGNKKKSLTELEIRDARGYYDSMQQVSVELLDEINRLERRLVAVSEEVIRKLM